MPTFQQHTNGRVAVHTDTGVYIDTKANLEADLGQTFPALPNGIVSRLYEPGVRHPLNGPDGVIDGGPMPWALGDAAIAAIASLMALQAARNAPVPIWFYDEQTGQLTGQGTSPPAAIPANATTLAPPAVQPGMLCVFGDGEWTMQDAPPPTLDDYRVAVQVQVDTVARQRGYDSAVSCASYKDSTISQWVAEAAAFISWRDSVWTYALAELAKVEGGQRSQPTIEDFLSELPAISWPAQGGV